MQVTAGDVNNHFQETEREIRAYIRENTARFRPSNARSACHLATLLAVIMLAVASTEAWTWAIIPAILVVGVCQYHLGVAIHEASHLNLFRPRWLNEVCGNLIAWMEGFDFPQFRAQHMLHHVHYGTPKDPDWEEYQLRGARSWPTLVARIVLERCMIGAVWKIFKRNVFPSAQVRAARRGSKSHGRWFSFPMIGLVQLILFVAFAWSTAWWMYLALWLLPLSIFPTLIAGVRMFGEHGQMDDHTTTTYPLLQARTGVHHWHEWSLLGAIEYITLGAFNFNYHHEHHWFPSIPFHALPIVHAMLWDRAHYIRFPECYVATYVGGTARLLFGDAAEGRRASEGS